MIFWKKKREENLKFTTPKISTVTTTTTTTTTTRKLAKKLLRLTVFVQGNDLPIKLSVFPHCCLGQLRQALVSHLGRKDFRLYSDGRLGGELQTMADLGIADGAVLDVMWSTVGC
uniref:Ubiquitin-like domain-containing protein n=1 Tax=Paramoeba aestuarina TaxID=180227 RepID=A0A7S4P7X7_9EUKA|mmetsp:Transcript_3794/g.5816  ORF Transcript_3794/g.5816 Transcript_3794/m.5816 type:complete len:115 (+) Transcript_3794:43-387(+)